jgi:hypothetical protein
MAKTVDYLKIITVLAAIVMLTLSYLGFKADDPGKELYMIGVYMVIGIGTVIILWVYAKLQKENQAIYNENNSQRKIIIEQNESLIDLQRENLNVQHKNLKELLAVNEEIVNNIRQNAQIKVFFQEAVDLMNQHRKEIHNRYTELNRKFDKLESNVNNSIDRISDRVKMIEDKLN